MSYESALKAAGAAVIDFKSFGSWQGEWVALVDYNNELGWVQGSYGSCNVCDAFQSEFGWSCDEESEDYQVRLVSFGESYLDGLMTTENITSYFKNNSSWDSESEAAYNWILSVAKLYEVDHGN
jgi:hypothetical protein